MLKIRGKQDIYISRGDTKHLGINLIERENNAETDYTIADTEYVVFRLWDKDYHRVIKELRSEVGTTIIEIPAEFTRSMKDSEFKYSVDLMLYDGTKETVIGQNPNTIPKFIILGA